jgi:hypothetical protein
VAKGKPAKTEQPDDLAEAIEVRTRAKQDLDAVGAEDSPKYVDAWVRADNAVRQREKDRRRSLTEFTDDEIATHIRSMPERRKEALLTKARGEDLAGKPLF